MVFQAHSTARSAQTLPWQGDALWVEALEQALAGKRPPGVGSLFLEERQDVSIVIATGATAAGIDRTRIRGLALDGRAGDLRFRADPGHEDAERLIRGGSAGPGAGWGSSADPGEWLPVNQGVRIVEGLVRALEGRLPSARLEARWIGFEQRVHIGRPGARVLVDRRRARRVRLQARLDRRGRSSLSTVEAVLRSDAPEPLPAEIDALAERVAARLEARLGAEAASSGQYPVVFAPGVGGVLVHELVGHALEADAALGGASWLACPGAGGFRASPELLVVDDPRRGRAAWRLDDEGEPARATLLLRDGGTAEWLHDRASATECARPPNGHGRRAGFRDPVRPRMGCTFVGAGRREPEEAIHGLEHGIYVRRLEAASTDPRAGSATFRVTDADRIRNGRISNPLVPHVLHVQGRVALAGVECVARDLAFDTCVGSCLHHGQSLAVSVGAPTFRIRNADVFF